MCALIWKGPVDLMVQMQTDTVVLYQQPNTMSGVAISDVIFQNDEQL